MEIWLFYMSLNTKFVVFTILKFQIDRDFRPVLYLTHVIQEFKNIGMS